MNLIMASDLISAISGSILGPAYLVAANAKQVWSLPDAVAKIGKAGAPLEAGERNQYLHHHFC
jgi:hypothetical protein